MRLKIILALLIVSGSLSAQISFSGAQEAYNKLFNGVLIVRLYRQLPKQEALKEAGQNSKLAELQREVELEIKQIFDAFNNEYKATPVYFIYASETGRLLDGDSIHLLMNGRGEYVDTAVSEYLLVDFSTTRHQNLHGLIVWDWNGTSWVHPPSPFPSYISRYGFLRLSKRSYGEMVMRFNAAVMSNRKSNSGTSD